MEIEVQEFELPGVEGGGFRVILSLLCVYSTTRRPRLRTLCGTARQKSPCGGGEKEREEASKSKNLRNNA